MTLRECIEQMQRVQQKRTLCPKHSRSAAQVEIVDAHECHLLFETQVRRVSYLREELPSASQ